MSGQEAGSLTFLIPSSAYECLCPDPALNPWALCLPLQVRVGAFQFSSVPRLEFPLDSLSTQQEVKAKLKRMVFKYVCSDTAAVRRQLVALKIVLEGFGPALGCPEKAAGIQKPSCARRVMGIRFARLPLIIT